MKMRYNLRFLIFAFTAICLVCALFVHPYQRHREAVLTVNRLGGDVHYHESSRFKNAIDAVTMPLFGAEGSLYVKEIYFGGWRKNDRNGNIEPISSTIVDEDLKVLK